MGRVGILTLYRSLESAVARGSRDRSRRLDELSALGSRPRLLDQPGDRHGECAVAERDDRAEWIDRECAGINQSHGHRHASDRIARDLVFDPNHGDRPWCDAYRTDKRVDRRNENLLADRAEGLNLERKQMRILSIADKQHTPVARAPRQRPTIRCVSNTVFRHQTGSGLLSML